MLPDHHLMSSKYEGLFAQRMFRMDFVAIFILSDAGSSWTIDYPLKESLVQDA